MIELSPLQVLCRSVSKYSKVIYKINDLWTMSLKRLVGSYRCIKFCYTWEYIMCRSKARRDCLNCGHFRILPEKEVDKKYSNYCSLIIYFFHRLTCHFRLLSRIPFEIHEHSLYIWTLNLNECLHFTVKLLFLFELKLYPNHWHNHFFYLLWND